MEMKHTPISEGLVTIRESSTEDTETILSVNRAAFGEEEEARLVADLLADSSANPLLSLIAEVEGETVGHILFTSLRLAPDEGLRATILAPMAVRPAFQRKGIGGSLIEAGKKTLSDRGFDFILVLGHPTYYPPYGFKPAGPYGFIKPFREKAEPNDVCWMIHLLRDVIEDTTPRKVICASTLMKPEYWPGG